MKKKNGKAILFFAPFAVCFLTFWVLPFLYGLYMSFRKISLTKGDRGFVGFENYISLFEQGSMHAQDFALGLKNTLIFAAASVPLLIIAALALALIIDALPARLKSVYRTIFFMSYAISVTAVSSVFLWLFNGNGGYVNNLLVKAHILQKPVPWLESQPFAWIVLVAATVWWTVGYNMMLFINGLNEIDGALYEAASVDGAGFATKFRYITLPGIKNVLAYVTLTSAIASFNMYGQANLITRGGPAQSTKTLIMVIQDVILKKNNLGVGNAMALVMGLIVMAFALCQQYLTREKKELKEVNGGDR